MTQQSLSLAFTQGSWKFLFTCKPAHGRLFIAAAFINSQNLKASCDILIHNKKICLVFAPGTELLKPLHTPKCQEHQDWHLVSWENPGWAPERLLDWLCVQADSVNTELAVGCQLVLERHPKYSVMRKIRSVVRVLVVWDWRRDPKGEDTLSLTQSTCLSVGNKLDIQTVEYHPALKELSYPATNRHGRTFNACY